MDINYIIVAHERPLQLKRLINRLSSSHAHFYVHIDKKVDIKPFFEALSGCSNICLVDENDREVCRWGGIGIVLAVLVCMRHILQEGNNGPCVLLSVQDYPLVSNAQIEDFFESNQSKDFIDIQPFPISDWIDDGWYRLSQFHYQFGDKKYSTRVLPSLWDSAFYSKFVTNVITVAKLIVHGQIPFHILKRRDYSIVKTPCGGHGWWILSASTVRAVMSFLDQQPDYLLFFHRVHVPDEIIFHSIIRQIRPESELCSNRTYTNWQAGGASPKVFNENDFDELKNASGSFLFARKFSEQDDDEILDLLDKHLLIPEKVDS